jgi:hypothetical protein
VPLLLPQLVRGSGAIFLLVARAGLSLVADAVVHPSVPAPGDVRSPRQGTEHAA